MENHITLKKQFLTKLTVSFKWWLQNQYLKEIDLFLNQIGDEGAVTIADALKINSSLKKINLGSNELSDAGCLAIASALELNSTLIEIDLSYNYIQDIGAIAIANALKINTDLQVMYLNFNTIGTNAAILISNILLSNNDTITKFYLNDNPIEKNGIIKLKNVKNVDTGFKKIRLRTFAKTCFHDEVEY